MSAVDFVKGVTHHLEQLQTKSAQQLQVAIERVNAATTPFEAFFAGCVHSRQRVETAQCSKIGSRIAPELFTTLCRVTRSVEAIAQKLVVSTNDAYAHLQDACEHERQGHMRLAIHSALQFADKIEKVSKELDEEVKRIDAVFSALQGEFRAMEVLRGFTLPRSEFSRELDKVNKSLKEVLYHEPDTCKYELREELADEIPTNLLAKRLQKWFSSMHNASSSPSPKKLQKIQEQVARLVGLRDQAVLQLRSALLLSDYPELRSECAVAREKLASSQRAIDATLAALPSPQRDEWEGSDGAKATHSTEASVTPIPSLTIRGASGVTTYQLPGGGFCISAVGGVGK